MNPHRWRRIISIGLTVLACALWFFAGWRIHRLYGGPIEPEPTTVYSVQYVEPSSPAFLFN